MSVKDKLASEKAAQDNQKPPKDERLDEIARLSAELHAEGKDFSIEKGQILPPRLDTEREHTPRDGSTCSA